MPSFPPQDPQAEDLLNYDVPVSLSRRLDWQTLTTSSTKWDSEPDLRMIHFGPDRGRLPVELVALQERTSNLIRLEKAERVKATKLKVLLDISESNVGRLHNKINSLKKRSERSNAKNVELRKELKSLRREFRQLKKQHESEIAKLDQRIVIMQDELESLRSSSQ